MGHAHDEEPKITIFHVTAPTCWWSWGYEGTLNRVRAVYGEQVELRTFYGTVWEDFDEYLKENELTVKGVNEWARESVDLMGVPIRANYGPREPRNLLPVTHATMAALRQGRERGERFVRAVLRRFVVEGLDVTRDEVLAAAAREAGLNLAALKKDSADTKARAEEVRHQGAEWPHLPIGFYNLAVTDGENRTVLIDHAFEPKVLEQAIDYLSGGTLAKRAPPDALAYLRAHGLTPTQELARVTGIPGKEMEARLSAWEKEGRVARAVLAGAPHWMAASADR